MEKAEYLRGYRRARADRMAAERLDVPEGPAPKRGCNARRDGKRCGARVVSVSGGPFSERRLCADHVRLYREHDRVLARISELRPRAPQRRVAGLPRK